jgi:hypothetical protein
MGNRVLAALTVGTAVFFGCAESDYSSQGSAASSETESSLSVSNTDPGVAAESGSAGATLENQPAEERFNTLGSASAPSAIASANVATNATDASQNESNVAASATQNEQGTQTSPEPKTGDDANPDSVQPER